MLNFQTALFLEIFILKFQLRLIWCDIYTFSFDQPLVEELRRLFDKYLVKILDFKQQNCKELISIAQLNGVSSLCKLFDSLGTVENGVSVLILGIE